MNKTEMNWEVYCNYDVSRGIRYTVKARKGLVVIQYLLHLGYSNFRLSDKSKVVNYLGTKLCIFSTNEGDVSFSATKLV